MSTQTRLSKIYNSIENLLRRKLFRFQTLFINSLLSLFVGFILIFRILSVLGDVIPFVGSLVGFATGLVSFVLALVVGGIVIAIGWLFVRPLLSISLIIGAGAIAFAYFKYGRKKTEPLTV